jgi:LuxR family transcriptional regulator of csgAB operon
MSVDQVQADAIRLTFEGIRGAGCIMRNNNRRFNSKKKPYKTASDILIRSELEILAFLAAGATDEEIADKLDISISTVKTTLSNVFKKIDVSDRLQAALWVVKHLR